MDEKGRVEERLRRIESRTPVKGYLRRPREADGGEFEIATYPDGKDQVLGVKIRGVWRDLQRFGADSASASGSAAPTAPTAGKSVASEKAGSDVTSSLSKEIASLSRALALKADADHTHDLTGAGDPGSMDMGDIVDTGSGFFDCGAIA